MSPRAVVADGSGLHREGLSRRSHPARLHRGPDRPVRSIGPNPTAPSDHDGGRTAGRQKFSWIHLDDLISAIEFVDEQAAIEGPVNFAAPEPSDNRSLMAALRSAVGAPLGLPA